MNLLKELIGILKNEYGTQIFISHETARDLIVP